MYTHACYILYIVHVSSKLRNKLVITSHTIQSYYIHCPISYTLYIKGLAGYVSFRDGTSPFILDNFQQNWTDIFYILIIIHLLILIPSQLIILRYNFYILLTIMSTQKDDDVSNTPEINTISSIVITMFLLIVLLSTVFGILASRASDGLVFALVLNVTGE